MTPGRSLLENTSGRSMAPVAMTMVLARSCVSTMRGWPFDGSGCRWLRFSTSTARLPS